MPSEKQALEGAGVPLRSFALAAAATFAGVLASLALVFGLYRLWVNGPQATVRPAPLANRAAPALETALFRSREPPLRAPATDGYRWRDPGHARVSIPIERAMAMTAARGAGAFDPPQGAAPSVEPAR